MHLIRFFLLFTLPLVSFAQNLTYKPDTKTYPVVLGNDTLFQIQNRFGSLSANERAVRATERLEKLQSDFSLKVDSISIAESETTSDVVYKNDILFSVSQADADSLKINRSELANRYRAEMVKNMRNYQSQTDFYGLLIRFAEGLLILIVLGIVIFFLNKYSNRMLGAITRKLSSRFNGIKIKDYQLISKKGEALFLRRVFNVIKYAVILFLIYITLPIIFRLFPWTKGWSDNLINFVLSPLKKILDATIGFVPDLITIVVLLVVFKYINKLIKFLATEIEVGNLKINGFYQDWAKPTYNIVRFILYAFMIVVIWPFLPGSDSEIFKGVSVFLGLLISFGSSTAIGNIVAGLVITYMRPFKIGDRVKIGDITGDVIEKAFLVTRLRTIKNEIITIPNGAILNGNTTNYSSIAQEEGLIVHTTVTIGYDVPWVKVHEMLIEASSRCDLISKDKNAFVLQTSLDDWYVSYQLNAYTKYADKMAVIYSSLHQEIQNVFFENGVEIMSPHYQTIRDGNEITVPVDYRPKDYKVPGFNLNKSDERQS